MSRMKRAKAFLAGVLAAALLAVPAHAQEESIRISSYKGDTLPAGVRSGLMISPSKNAAQMVTSSDPAVVTIENVLGFWVAVTQAEGTATVTATGRNGETASVTLTVSAVPAKEVPAPTEAMDMTANMDIRLKMVEYINQVRRENGKSELPIEESLMNAAQDVSAQCVTEHRPYDHMALIRYGWPHGGFYNLTRFGADDSPDIAQRAVNNWVNSPGHFQTMLLDEAACVGTGVTFDSGRVYCYMVVGDPTAHNPYE